LYTNQINKN